MELKLLTFFPEKAKEFFAFATSTLGLTEEELFKLYFLSFRIRSLSDIPIYKFLERAIPFIKFDEIGKKEYLLTLSIHTLREVFLEHFDLKFSKNLFLAVKDKLPKNFLKDCMPKREVVLSQDLSFEFLRKEDLSNLPSYLKVKHFVFTFHTIGECEAIMEVLSTINYFLIKKHKTGWFELYIPLSISEFLYFSYLWKERDFFKEGNLSTLTDQLKALMPDCFEKI
ncbi:MAG: hypothetical protein ACK4UR_04725 [Caldimicrobium sp.]